MAKAAAAKVPVAPKSRGDIVHEVAAQVQISNVQAEAVVRAFEETVVRSLKAGGEVRLTGFGTFKVSERAARLARNPQTGESVKVAARKVPRFTPGQGFKTSIAEGKAKAAPKAAAAKVAPAKAAAAKAAPAKAPAKPAKAPAKAAAKGGKKK